MSKAFGNGDILGQGWNHPLWETYWKSIKLRLPISSMWFSVWKDERDLIAHLAQISAHTKHLVQYHLFLKTGYT